MIKYASNAFLATKISFINEIAHLCELLGADITKITEGMGLDKRIGPQFLQAGLGYGGSCFPKDTQALNQVAGDHGHDFKLLKAVIEVNNLQRKRFLEKIKKGLKNLKGKTVGVLGLSFKPHTDDLREAPSIDIIGWLIARKAAVKVYDPKAMKNTQAVFKDKIKYCSNAYETARDSDALIIVTEWQEFTELDLARIKSLMKGRIIFDGRNIYDPDKVKELGFRYLGIGR
jgi:UDPglucose 6-dehydrogenase